jgi:hypothetical protein
MKHAAPGSDEADVIQQKIDQTNDAMNGLTQEGNDLVDAETRGDKGKIKKIARPNIQGWLSDLRIQLSDEQKQIPQNAVRINQLQGDIDRFQAAVSEANQKGW